MKLNYITLNNFRSYCGEQTISFTTEKDKNVTIVNGVNGAGKTSLCIALNWGLYGTEFVYDKFGDIGELVSKHPIVSIQSQETFVKIGYIYQDQNYTVERRYIDNGASYVTLTKDVDNYTPHQGEDAEDKIQLMIPKEVSIHFFFDGEKIDTFALPGSEQQVKDAVTNVLKIEMVKRSITHLKGIIKRYDNNLKEELSKQPPGELHNLLEEKLRQEKLREEFKSNINDFEKEISAAEEQIRDIDQKLSEIKDSQDDANKRNQLERELEEYLKEKINIENEIHWNVNHGYIPMANEVIGKAIEILDKENTSSIPVTILNEILEQLNCICNRSINPDGKTFQHLSSLLERSNSTELSSNVRETYAELKLLSKVRISETLKDFQSALMKNQEIVRDIASHQASIEEISERLKNYDQEMVRKLQIERDGLQQKIGTIKGEIQNYEKRINEIEEEIKKLRLQIGRAETSSEKSKKLQQYTKLAQDVFDAMETIHQLFAEDVRQKIEPKVEEIFKKLVWKSSSFQQVHFSKKFELQVIDNFGEKARSELSAGERQVLSLAFIVAMAQVAAEEMPFKMENDPFPIIMDTPFGRLSQEPRVNITKVIPDIAEQLILFVTDTELDHVARGNLLPRIGKEYILQFNQEKGITTIESLV